VLDRGADALARAYVWASSARTFTSIGIGPIPAPVIAEWCDRNDVHLPEYRAHAEEVLRLVDAETLRRARAEASRRTTPEPGSGGKMKPEKPKRRKARR
jgi:hypothetical protein